MGANLWMIIGFLLAAYSVVANDSLQTLGTYISSNKKRTPKVVQMIFICTVTIVVLMLGWSINNGDPAWGRLEKFPTPENFTWVYIFPHLRCWVSPPGEHLSVRHSWCSQHLFQKTFRSFLKVPSPVTSWRSAWV